MKKWLFAIVREPVLPPETPRLHRILILVALWLGLLIVLGEAMSVVNLLNNLAQR